MLGYGFPAVLAIVLALTTRDIGRCRYRLIAAATAFVLLDAAYLSLEVRTLYHGPVLSVAADQQRGAIHLFGWCGSAYASCCCSPASGCARSRRGSPRPR